MAQDISSAVWTTIYRRGALITRERESLEGIDFLNWNGLFRLYALFGLTRLPETRRISKSRQKNVHRISVNGLEQAWDTQLLNKSDQI